MSKTNQVCITCAQRDICQYYDPNRTFCVPVKVSDYGQFAGSLQSTIDWQQARITIAAHIAGGLAQRGVFSATKTVEWTDALIEELQK